MTIIEFQQVVQGFDLEEGRGTDWQLWVLLQDSNVVNDLRLSHACKAALAHKHLHEENPKGIHISMLHSQVRHLVSSFVLDFVGQEQRRGTLA